MKIFAHIITTLLFLSNINAQNDIVGIWKAIDDKDGKPSSHVEIFKSGDEYKGKIIKIFDNPEDSICEKCEGDKKDEPIMGLEILWGMMKSGSSWSKGRILDPEIGSDFKCKITLENNDILKMRGYIGLPALGRTQTWYRVN